MTLQEILDRIQNVLYQGVDTESQDLDLLRHDLENDIIDNGHTATDGYEVGSPSDYEDDKQLSLDFEIEKTSDNDFEVKK